MLASDQAPRLAELLGEAGHAVGIVHRVTEAPPPGAIALIERSLNGGFEGGPDGLALVTDRELFGTVRVRRPKAMRRVVPRDLLERLTPGDVVVHIDHGIARYEQMLRRGEAGQERDYLELSFAAGDRIFVPVEQINRVSAATRAGSTRRCSRLGGTDWLRTKQRVRKAVNDLAEELLALYAKREAAEGFAYAPDSPWQGEMEASFPYEETPDQLRAAEEVKVDMQTRRPMDRLVVGDVGYGKTEVALRAAFKATQDGKQVAVLVPTTVLAGQHFQTFSQRFAAFPLTVRLLSRFVGAKEQEATVKGLAAGTVDIVIGTHRLLSKDVAFRDLGLVVIDEEQRFGVAAKERLKQLRSAVDVLTLSATPIPRTLNLALAGIRDMSVIETPPEDRLPIQTRVAEASAGLVRDAILRELDRGGQVFFVHNRVETIEAQAEQLRRLLPGARIVVGHGQMGEGALEKVMLTFADGAADVLVCTTIIESGLDIPNANTIVIDRADTLGLAQLYQLRGRVGRSQPARLRLPAVPPPRADERGGAQAAAGDLQRVGAGRRVPDRARRPRDPRRRQHPGRRAVGAHGGGRVRPVLAAAGRGRRGGEGAARVPRAGPGGAAGGGGPAGGRAPPRRLRAGRGPEAGALPAARAGADDRRPRRVPPGGHRPLRADAAAGAAAGRGRGAAAVRRVGGRGEPRARGGLAGRPVRDGDDAGDGDAAARAGGGGRTAARRAARRHDVRLEPGADPAAARPAQGLDADAGRRVPAGRRQRGRPGRGARSSGDRCSRRMPVWTSHPPSTAYLSSLSADGERRWRRSARRRRRGAPGATETIAYGMPALRSHGGQFLVLVRRVQASLQPVPGQRGRHRGGGDGARRRTSPARARSSSRPTSRSRPASSRRSSRVRMTENAAKAARDSLARLRTRSRRPCG